MTRNANRRAVTLTEVLIAIFLMGIGLMAILSLFPLGAAQMAQALQDQRAAEAATTAAGIARTIWKQACDADPNDAQTKFLVFTPGAPSTTGTWNPQPTPQQPFVLAMDDPNRASDMPSSAKNSLVAIPNAGSPAAAGAPSATGPSYPVLVDPIGWLTQGNTGNATAQWWVAGVVAGVLPRRPLCMLDTTATVSPQPWVTLGAGSNSGSGGTLQPSVLRIEKQFSLMDDMTFNFNGTPDLDGNVSTSDVAAPSSSQPLPVRKQGRYSWAFLFRRKNNADRTAVDITTILYSGRSLDVASPEKMFPGTGTCVTSAAGTPANPKLLTLAYSTTKPAIRRGNWVLDATLGNDDTGKPVPQGIFYRVVNVDDSVVTNPPSVTLELQTPLLGGPSATNARSIVVMDKVVEVFTKKDVSNVAPPMPY